MILTLTPAIFTLDYPPVHYPICFLIVDDIIRLGKYCFTLTHYLFFKRSNFSWGRFFWNQNWFCVLCIRKSGKHKCTNSLSPIPFGSISPSFSPGSWVGAESTAAEKHQDREEEKGNPVSWLSSEQPFILILSSSGKNRFEKYKTKSSLFLLLPLWDLGQLNSLG